MDGIVLQQTGRTGPSICEESILLVNKNGWFDNFQVGTTGELTAFSDLDVVFFPSAFNFI